MVFMLVYVNLYGIHIHSSIFLSYCSFATKGDLRLRYEKIIISISASINLYRYKKEIVFYWDK